MKKKRNFLTIISSLFGVFAICGLSLFSILDHKKDNTKVEAVDDYFVYQSVNDQYNESYVSDGGAGTRMLGEYNLQYVNVFTNNSYEFRFDTRFYFVHRANHDYEIFNGTSRGELFYFSHILDTTSVELDSSSYFRLCLWYTECHPSSVYPYDVLFVVCFSFDIYTLVNGQPNVTRSFSFDYRYTGRIYKDGNTQPFNSLSDGSFDYFYIPNYVNQYFIDEQVNVSKTGLEEAYEEGYYYGYNTGFNEGQSTGFNNGYESGYLAGHDEGYSEGYDDGYSEGFNADSTATTIMTGIFQVALVPLNFFLGIFNFEILGVNLSSIIQALFTIALTIIVLKMIIGKGGE